MIEVDGIAAFGEFLRSDSRRCRPLTLARRMNRRINAPQILARLDRSRFGILAPVSGGRQAFMAQLDATHSALRHPVKIIGRETSFAASIGVAFLVPGNTAKVMSWAKPNTPCALRRPTPVRVLRCLVKRSFPAP